MRGKGSERFCLQTKKEGKEEEDEEWEDENNGDENDEKGHGKKCENHFLRHHRSTNSQINKYYTGS